MKNKLFQWVCLVGVFILYSASTLAKTPVMVGGDSELDACSEIANIVAKKFIYLKDAPNLNANNVTMLSNDKRQPLNVLVCDASADQQWVGVVVQSPDKDCGVSSPIAMRQKYQGVCFSGWLLRRQLKVR
jgi:hypothetical protein